MTQMDLVAPFYGLRLLGAYNGWYNSYAFKSAVNRLIKLWLGDGSRFLWFESGSFFFFFTFSNCHFFFYKWIHPKQDAFMVLFKNILFTLKIDRSNAFFEGPVRISNGGKKPNNFWQYSTVVHEGLANSVDLIRSYN